MDVFIQIIADGLVIPIVVVGIIVLIWKTPKGERFERYSRVLMAGLTAYLIAKLVAQVWQPSSERPFEILGVDPGALYLNNPGFPSDHVLFVTAIALAVWFTTRQKTISIILAIGVVLVAVGRVVALVHTPLDVIFGAIFAGVGALWYLTAYTGKRKPSKRR